MFISIFISISVSVPLSISISIFASISCGVQNASAKYLLNTRHNLLNIRHYFRNAKNLFDYHRGKKTCAKQRYTQLGKTSNAHTRNYWRPPCGDWWYWELRWEDDGVRNRQISFAYWHNIKHEQSPPHRNKRQPHHASAVGQPFSPTPACMPSRLPCYLCRQTSWPTVRGFCPPLGTCSPNLKPPPPIPGDFQGGEGARLLDSAEGLRLWTSALDFVALHTSRPTSWDQKGPNLVRGSKKVQ